MGLPIKVVIYFSTYFASDRLSSKVERIGDTLVASSLAAAIAAQCLAKRKHAKAINWCEIAIGLNHVDLFPQQLYIAVDEQMNNKVGEFSAYLRNSFCPRPFGHFETTPSGDVFACDPGWLSKPIGNLAQANWESIWRSDAAQDIRNSILDGSFRYCNPRYCNILVRRQLNGRASISEEQLRHYREQAPTSAVFSHDRSCNLSCPACRKEQFAVGKSDQARYVDLTKDALIPLMEICEDIKITGSGDPFSGIHFRNLLTNYCVNHKGPRKITIHTNGVLFDKNTWITMKLENNVKEVIVSVDATTEDTYRAIRRGGDYSRLMTNLEFLGSLRAEGRFDRLVLVCVVQRGNYREIPDFVRMAKRFNADCALFWQIKNWGTFTVEEFLNQTVAFPNHPEYPVLIEVLQDPIMHDPIVTLVDLPVSGRS